MGFAEQTFGKRGNLTRPMCTNDRSTSEESRKAAEQAGLIYVSDTEPGISRRKTESGCAYYDAHGNRIRNARTLKRINALAIPPAYSDVWICAKSNGHIQATGRDSRGSEAIPLSPALDRSTGSDEIRACSGVCGVAPCIASEDSRRHGQTRLPRERVLATIVHLLETTLIRVGNEGYAQANKSFGLTTLRNRHVAVNGGELRFRFKGKSGKSWNLQLKDRRVAKIIRACQELPGQRLFEYVDADGNPQAVGSADVNEYLRETTNREITAKDFRTWHGTVLAAMALREFESFDSQALAKKNVRAAIERVAARLGNTATICRKCYIHPEVLNSYLDGKLLEEIELEVEAELREDLERLRPEEAAVLALLNKRLKTEIGLRGLEG